MNLREEFDAGVRGRAAALRSELLAALLAVMLSPPATAQISPARSGHTLWGDFTVSGPRESEAADLTFQIVLYNNAGHTLARQSVTRNGRYRIFNVPRGEYQLVVEYENQEVARIPLMLLESVNTDIRRDIELEWRGRPAASGTGAATVSAADHYQRRQPQQSLFERAQAALDKKEYDQAASLLKKITDSDPADFQAWSELGTAYLLQKKEAEAESAYESAIQARPTFFLALLNLGRVRAARKKHEEAIEPLSRAVEAQPKNGAARLLLGETYLQMRKGSAAVPHLEEAARLGLPEAHLRLATLYNAAGLKERAASEYEQFLAKNPDHPERKKFEKYIAENKKK